MLAKTAMEKRLASPRGDADATRLLLSTASGQPTPWWVRSRAIIGIAILVPFGAAAFFLEPWEQRGLGVMFAWEMVGWTLFLAGTVFRFWATAYIGGRKRREIVCEGPYSLCRNPLYFGTFLITLSIAAFLGSPIFAAGIALASFVYLWTTVGAEERDLRIRGGDVYLEYCRRVPRFWPRLWGLHTAPTVEVDVRSLRIEAVRALRWAILPLVVHLAMQFHTVVRT